MVNLSLMLALASLIPAGIETKDAAPTPEERIKQDMAILSGELKTALAQFKDESKRVSGEEMKAVKDNLTARIDSLENLLNNPNARGNAHEEPKSYGEQFIETEDFLRLAKNKRGTASFEVKGGLHQKTTITTTTVGNSTPGILTPQRVGGIITPQLRKLTIRDILNVGTTTSNAIEYVKENVFTNNASPQVEASDKAESALTFTISSASIRTIAHWLPATRQILDDFGQLQSYIDTRLMYGLKLVEENHILSGDGLGQHLSGLITQATAYSTGYNVAGDTKLDKIRHMIYQARLAEFPVDGIVLNPQETHAIELLKDEAGGANKGNYVVGDPTSGTRIMMVWGVPVVETTAITAGTALVGSFAMGAQLWDRMGATIDVSTEHSDYFVKNMVAIRCEERVGLTVYRPGAFIYASSI